MQKQKVEIVQSTLTGVLSKSSAGRACALASPRSPSPSDGEGARGKGRACALASPPFPLSIGWRGGQGGRGRPCALASPPFPLSIRWRGGQGEGCSYP